MSNSRTFHCPEELAGLLEWAGKHPDGTVELSCAELTRLVRVDRALRAVLDKCEHPEAGFRKNTIRNVRDIARKALVPNPRTAAPEHPTATEGA